MLLHVCVGMMTANYISQFWNKWKSCDMHSHLASRLAIAQIFCLFRKLILTESNETYMYTECSRLQINDMCQTILEENVYWLSMSIERQGNQGSTSPDTMCVVPYIAFCVQCLLLYQDSVPVLIFIF